jgi:hypothetical protein
MSKHIQIWKDGVVNLCAKEDSEAHKQWQRKRPTDDMRAPAYAGWLSDRPLSRTEETTGTGFFIEVNRSTFLVTAWHVLKSESDGDQDIADYFVCSPSLDWITHNPPDTAWLFFTPPRLTC